MPKRSQPPEPPALALKEPHDSAGAKLTARIEKALEVGARQVQNLEDAEAFNKDYIKWDEYNATLLQSLFTNDDPLTQYRWSVSATVVTHDETAYDAYHRNLEFLRGKGDHLESLVERLQLIPLATGVAAAPPPVAAPLPTDRGCRRLQPDGQKLR